jgi:resuscitation-promoting factor RpfB
VVIQLQRATEVLIDTGEASDPVQTQGATVAHALWNAGVEVGPGDRLSQPPGALLETGDQLAYLPAKPLTIQMEEQEVQVYSAAETVGEALAEAGISLQGLNYSQPAEDQPLPPDGVLQILRVNEEINLEETLVTYQSKYEPDHELELDKQRTLIPGQYGVQVIRERVRYEDGQEVFRETDGEWVAAEPQDQTIGYGTKPVPQVMDTPDGQIEYWRAVRVYATSYSPCRLGTGDGRCGYITSSGRTLTKGIVAVTLTWYRMMAGQQVYIPGYGRGVIADVGGGIPGTPWIDLGFEDHDYQPMVGWMTMYFLTPIPANVPWILP